MVLLGLLPLRSSPKLKQAVLGLVPSPSNASRRLRRAQSSELAKLALAVDSATDEDEAAAVVQLERMIRSTDGLRDLVNLALRRCASGGGGGKRTSTSATASTASSSSSHLQLYVRFVSYCTQLESSSAAAAAAADDTRNKIKANAIIEMFLQERSWCKLDHLPFAVEAGIAANSITISDLPVIKRIVLHELVKVQEIRNLLREQQQQQQPQ